MSGHSVIDATMTPDNHLLLRESIYMHRAPSLRCATPPRSAVFDAEEETPLHLWAHRQPPAAMSCKSSSGKARKESRSSRRRPQEGKRCHAIAWSCSAGPGLSPEESDPRAEEVGELHNGPQEESDIRRHRAVGFRPEQPYLRTLTLPDEDGEPQRRHHANPLAQAPLARRRRHHHARPPTSPPAEANGPDRPSPPRPDLKPRHAVASRQPRAAGSPSPARGRGRRAGQPPRRPKTPRTRLPPPRAHAGNLGRRARGDPRRHRPPARALPGGLIRRRREGGRAVEGSGGGVPRAPPSRPWGRRGGRGFARI